MNHPLTSGLRAHLAGREVLVTGATGFLGKALVHALVARLDVACVHIAVRPRKGHGAEERLTELLADDAFDDVRAVARSKVRAFPWDLAKPFAETGSAEELAAHPAFVDLAGVESVIHCAASVSFQAPLPENERANVDASLHAFALAEALAGRRAEPLRFVHVSTAFSVGGESADAHPEAPLKASMVRAERYQNTYTFTKARAELALGERACSTGGRVRLAIVRPSIVFGARAFPRPGWNPTFTASAGIVALVGRGLLRWLPGASGARIDHVPVDTVVHALLLADLALARGEDGLVVHACAGPRGARTWGSFAHHVLTSIARARASLRASDPASADDSSDVPFVFLPRPLAALRTWALLEVPGLVLSALPERFRACARWRRLGADLQLAARLHAETGALFAPFTCADWTFDTTNLARLHAELPDNERAAFPVDVSDLDWAIYMRDCYAKLARSAERKAARRTRKQERDRATAAG